VNSKKKTLNSSHDFAITPGKEFKNSTVLYNQYKKMANHSLDKITSKFHQHTIETGEVTKVPLSECLLAILRWNSPDE
jgi:hypothetical protein